MPIVVGCRFAAMPLALALLLGSGVPDVRAGTIYHSLYANYCSPYVVGGCSTVSSTEAEPRGLSLGGAYGFSSGYGGGLTIASGSFTPGAAPLLQAGRYESGIDSSLAYSFQVKGAPDTLVPVRVFGRLSAGPIVLTTGDGVRATLANGSGLPAPTDRWFADGFSSLKVIPTRRGLGVTGGSTSLASQYGVYPFDGTYFCKACNGGSSILDLTIWVYSNSDVDVSLDAAVLLRYDALGDGKDPLATYGSIYMEADPTFRIDDPAYSAFSIVGVPDGPAPPGTEVPGGGTAVPEPAGWAVMILGVATAATLRSRFRAAGVGAGRGRR